MAPYLDVDALIPQLTLEEKISLLSGRNFWETCDIPRLGIPAMRFSDGPNGARGARFFNGVAAACMPCGTGLAATWDTDLIRRAGQLLGNEIIAKGGHVSLGPTVNMQRSPLGGRGFESYSEDPVLAGAMASAMVNGVQGTGVAACIKHFVCNDGEHERQAVNCVVSERALREIYLYPFMLCQRDAKPLAYMTAYNKVNGLHVNEDPRIMKDILQKEWGFNGLIMSDWFGTYSATEAVNAGLDLEMPGPPRQRGPNIMVAVGSRKISEHTIDDRIRNLFNLINRVAPLGFPENIEEKTIDTPEIRQTLRDLANAGVVLLKNENNVLPLKKDKTIAVIGPNAKIAAYCGGGSASLKATYLTTPFEGIAAHAPHAQYTLGCHCYKELPLLSSMSTREDGRPGVTCRFYNEPPEVEGRVCRDIVQYHVSDMFLPDYKHPDVNPELFYMDLVSTITPEESGEYLFGCSVRGTARVLVDGELVVDNATVQRPGSTFMGAGTLEETGTKYLEAGRTYKVVLHFGSGATQTFRKKGSTSMRGGGVRVGCTRKIDAQTEIDKAVALAKTVDQVVVVAGLTGEWEAEGFDRPDMDLPGLTDALVRAVAAANPNTAVVIQSGTPVTMPWANEVPALVHASFGGNECGNAIGDVLFGAFNPCGKLPLTYPKRLEDNPAFLNFGSENGRTLYGEDVYVGYRYYDRAKLAPLFHFGHGLSYTSFEYTDFKVDKKGGDKVTTSVTIKNTGAVAGASVAQVYISQQKPLIKRPPKELKGFKKVFLEPGESKTVEVEVLLKYATSYWDEERQMWISEKGAYDVLVGESSEAPALAGTFEVEQTSWWLGL
ncbi:beta-glucosidase [Microdochium trichocladiopsis]|uniref:Probable beta-glucosidase I n=1 Tax=Microdochium trichocladiopsis TaxID=1682393 RepID=A0A9P8XXH7_9PEZI|nr:beta-glucosidase [Microdochium trichocladiopsis]KAH7024379.1 beta-glucosidase [Microdochium trichocladiopsis]